MAALVMRDVSRAGHELGRSHLDDLPSTLTLATLLQARIREDVERYNAAPGPVFEGLVQPSDAVRHSDGHHLPRPRPLEVAPLLAAAQEAVERGMLSFVVDGEETSDLTRAVDVDLLDEVIALLRRPVIARTG